jgi:hypothetical protein
MWSHRLTTRRSGVPPTKGADVGRLLPTHKPLTSELWMGGWSFGAAVIGGDP